MADEIGLLASITPQVDESSAQRAREDIEREVESEPLELGVEIDEDALEQAQELTDSEQRTQKIEETKRKAKQALGAGARKTGGVAKRGAKFGGKVAVAKTARKMGIPMTMPQNDVFGALGGTVSSSEGSAGGTGGAGGAATGTSATEPDEVVPLLSSQLEVQEEILENVEEGAVKPQRARGGGSSGGNGGGGGGGGGTGIGGAGIFSQILGTGSLTALLGGALGGLGIGGGLYAGMSSQVEENDDGTLDLLNNEGYLSAEDLMKTGESTGPEDITELDPRDRRQFAGTESPQDTTEVDEEDRKEFAGVETTDEQDADPHVDEDKGGTARNRDGLVSSLSGNNTPDPGSSMGGPGATIDRGTTPGDEEVTQNEAKRRSEQNQRQQNPEVTVNQEFTIDPRRVAEEVRRKQNKKLSELERKIEKATSAGLTR